MTAKEAVRYCPQTAYTFRQHSKFGKGAEVTFPSRPNFPAKLSGETLPTPFSGEIAMSRDATVSHNHVTVCEVATFPPHGEESFPLKLAKKRFVRRRNFFAKI